MTTAKFRILRCYRRWYIKLPLGLQRRKEIYQLRTLELFGNILNRNKYFALNHLVEEEDEINKHFCKKHNFELLLA